MSTVSVEELTSKKCQPCHGGVPPVPQQQTWMKLIEENVRRKRLL